MKSWAVLALVLVGCGRERGEPTGEIPADPSAPVAEVSPVSVAASDWHQWRGPNGNNVAATSVPTEWNDTDKVIWKVKIPGRGHSCPTVVGDRIFLATADEGQQVQSVLGLDRQTGEQLWKTDLHRGNFPSRSAMHDKSTHATATVACDGERLFAVFFNAGKVHVTALDLKGQQLWQKEVGGFTSKFGYAPSPTLHREFVIVAADHEDGGYLVSLHRATGDIRWRTSRPKAFTYSSPIVATVGGKEQILISGADKVSSYDPVSGQENWSVKGTTEATCGTLVWDDNTIYASGGYPGTETLAVKADGSDVLWRNKEKAYVPSMLVHEGYLYSVGDDGIGFCWDAVTGKQKWKARVTGNYSASPLLVNGLIYLISESGDLKIIKANPQKYELVNEIKVADEAFATPVACDGRLYLRVAAHDGGRQEWLYCIGE